MTSEAIVIGVNQYEFLQPLQYARQDALALKTFLEMEAKFDRVYYFADDAPVVNGLSMRPTRNNLRRMMRDTFKKPFMGDGDNFWFFFSGHGMRDGERDFLMPIDGDPDDVAESGISTAQVSEWLRGCGADNVVMVLDACRNGGRRDGKGIGDETKADCRQTGVISLFSCSPNQFSYELPEYQQGAFTKALLEGLGTQGACATVARLDEYLKRRVPEVVRECLGNSVNQLPYSIAEPINKSHLILMPQHSRPEDLNALKMDALWAEKRGDLRLALQCWLRVNVASGGLDADFHDAVFDLRLKLRDSTIQPSKPKSQTTSEVPLTKGDLGGSGIEAKSQELEKPIVPRLDPIPLTPLKRGNWSWEEMTFEFETAKVNGQGKVVDRKTDRTKGFRQYLDNDVFIDMVEIQGGIFQGAKVEPFLMSKTPITQAQWEAVVKLKQKQINVELKSKPSRFAGLNRPVERVNWWQAEEFCKQLSIATQHDYRLPSEAQWEYACRSGTMTEFYFGDKLTEEVANYGRIMCETTDVEKYFANAWGLYDMHGNIWEWCADHWRSDFKTPLKDSNPYLSSDNKANRVIRGGSWLVDSSYCRSAYRYHNSPSGDYFDGYDHVGLRLVCSRSRTLS